MARVILYGITMFTGGILTGQDYILLGGICSGVGGWIAWSIFTDLRSHSKR